MSRIMRTIVEAVTVYRLYRAGGHGIAYAIATAWRIAVRGVPF